MKLSNSDTSPDAVSRHGGKVIIARNIVENTTTDDNGNETTTYDYERYELPDGYIGDDYTVRKYAEIRKAIILTNWPLSAQQEAWDDNEFEGDSTKLDEFKAFKAALKLEYPKE